MFSFCSIIFHRDIYWTLHLYYRQTALFRGIIAMPFTAKCSIGAQAMEISAEQLKKLNDGEYTVYDIRSETDRAYGFIPGSVHTTADELENNPPADRDKK